MDSRLATGKRELKEEAADYLIKDLAERLGVDSNKITMLGAETGKPKLRVNLWGLRVRIPGNSGITVTLKYDGEEYHYFKEDYNYRKREKGSSQIDYLRSLDDANPQKNNVYELKISGEWKIVEQEKVSRSPRFFSGQSAWGVRRIGK